MSHVPWFKESAYGLSLVNSNYEYFIGFPQNLYIVIGFVLILNWYYRILPNERRQRLKIDKRASHFDPLISAPLHLTVLFFLLLEFNDHTL